MNEGVKVSIIVPVFNVEKYVRECLISIQNQTLKEIEIILINDGSTDDSIQNIADLIDRDKRIILINQKNGGLSSARNTGLEYAKGEYISFIDSDDYLNDKFLECLYIEAKRENLDIVRGSFQRPKDSDNKLAWEDVDVNKLKPDLVITGGELLKLLSIYNLKMMVWLSLYKRDFLDSNHLRFEEGIILEDVEFMPRVLLLARRVRAIKRKNYFYRVREDSILGNIQNSKKHLDAIGQFLKKDLLIKNVNNQESINYLCRALLYSYFSYAREVSITPDFELLNQATKSLSIRGVIPLKSYIKLKIQIFLIKRIGIKQYNSLKMKLF